MFSKKLRICLSLPILAIATGCASTQSFNPNTFPASSNIASRLHVNFGVADVSSQAPSRPSQISTYLRPTPNRFAPVPNQGAATRMGIGPSDFAPAGLQEFCIRLTTECGVEYRYQIRKPQSGFVLTSMGRDLETIHRAPARALNSLVWTAQNQQMVSSINRRVNRSMIGSTDEQAFGRYEYWTMPITNPEPRQSQGRPLADCEDFALEKRRALISAGIPYESLYLAVAYTAGTGMHAVLIVTTESGDFVLDNLNDWLTPWSKTGYVWIKRQSTTSLLDWAVAGRATLTTRIISQDPLPEINAQEVVLNSSRLMANNLHVQSDQSSHSFVNSNDKSLVNTRQVRSAAQFGLRGSYNRLPEPLEQRAPGQEQATSSITISQATDVLRMQPSSTSAQTVARKSVMTRSETTMSALVIKNAAKTFIGRKIHLIEESEKTFAAGGASNLKSIAILPVIFESFQHSKKRVSVKNNFTPTLNASSAFVSELNAQTLLRQQVLTNSTWRKSSFSATVFVD